MSKTLRIRKAPSPAPSRAKSGTSEDRLHQTSRDLMLELEMAAIDEGGEVAVRAAEIAAGSGIAITSLYHHFGSREGLIEEAQIERILRGYREGTVVFRRAVAECSSREGFRDLVVGTIRM
ncbi:MAG: TetR family transcriptional regulator, partial [Planctomycetota bacterium]